MDANLEVKEECTTSFNQLKMDKNLRYIIYKIENESAVTVEKSAPPEASFQDFLNDLKKDEPRFVVYDFPYKSRDNLDMNKLVFIHWSPDDAPARGKMVYASSKESLKRRFVGIYREVQACSMADLDHEEISESLR